MSKIVDVLKGNLIKLLAYAIDKGIDGAKFTKGIDKSLDKSLDNKLSEHIQRGVGTNILLEMGGGFWDEDPQKWADRLQKEVDKIRAQK